MDAGGGMLGGVYARGRMLGGQTWDDDKEDKKYGMCADLWKFTAFVLLQCFF